MVVATQSKIRNKANQRDRGHVSNALPVRVPSSANPLIYFLAHPSTSWTRFIRFVAAETAQVHVGEPVDKALDVGLAIHNGQPVKAYEILGSVFDPAAQVSQNVLTVKQILSPLSREQVGIVRCLGLNYADHAAEAKMAKPNAPVLFYKPATSVIGPEAKIVIPKVAQPVDQQLPDYEVELTIVIGKPTKNVSEDEALDYVLGYTVGNDVSFRFHQMNVSQWSFSKSFDDTTPIGPCIVAAHAIGDPQNLPLKTVLNEKTMQDGNTSNQLFTVKQTVSFLSQGTTLLPGSIIMTGTPKGVGFVLKPPLYCKHGDNINVSIGGGIGSLFNTFVEEGKGASAKL